MLWTSLVALGACSIVTIVPGLPVATLLLRRARPSLAVLLVGGALAGLSLWLLIGIPAVHLGLFRPTVLVPAMALVASVAWWAARDDLDLLRPGRPGPLSAFLAALAAPAVVLRDDPVYFAYQVADFGEYVNRGNVIADGGPFGGWFVNGFPLLMGEGHLLLGESRSVFVMPFIGLLVVTGILAVLRLAGTHPLIIAGVAVPLVFHVQSVWFSQFPASETLYAALLVGAMLLAVGALAGRDHRAAAAVGALGFLLVLTRGNGLVYIPFVVLGLAVAPVFVDPERTRHLQTWFASLAGGLWLGSLYDARFNPTYFLDKQAVPRLPGPVADLFGRLDEVLVAFGFTVVVAIGIAVAVTLGNVVEARRGRPVTFSVIARATVGVVVFGVVAAHVWVITPISYLPRYDVLGPLLWVAGGLAVIIWMGDRIDDGVFRFLIGWPLLTGLFMATFQAARLTKSMSVDAEWFLYWDRYFFSEAFPMLAIAGGAAVAVVWNATERRPSAKPVVVAVGALVLLVGSLDMARPTKHATAHAMFEDGYGELDAIHELLAEPIPVVYDGFRTRPDLWFWTNSSRVVASPIAETFGHHVLNGVGPLQADPNPTPSDIVALLAAHEVERAYVLQVNGADEWPEVAADGLASEFVGSVDIRFERLRGRSQVVPERQAWVFNDVYVRVLLVSVV